MYILSNVDSGLCGHFPARGLISCFKKGGCRISEDVGNDVDGVCDGGNDEGKVMFVIVMMTKMVVEIMFIRGISSPQLL